jgi:hypothetical protein
VDFAATPYLYPVQAGERNIVKVKLTGKRSWDDKLAYKLSGIELNDDIVEKYTWHHLDDFNPNTGTCTMQLVEIDIHIKTYPHFGSVALVEKYFNIKYK